jgi:hypothetical protein
MLVLLVTFLSITVNTQNQEKELAKLNPQDFIWPDENVSIKRTESGHGLMSFLTPALNTIIAL